MLRLLYSGFQVQMVNNSVTPTKYSIYISAYFFENVFQLYFCYTVEDISLILAIYK